MIVHPKRKHKTEFYTTAAVFIGRGNFKWKSITLQFMFLFSRTYRFVLYLNFSWPKSFYNNF